MVKKIFKIYLSLVFMSFLILNVSLAGAASGSVVLKCSSPFPVFDQRTKTLQLWVDLIEKRTEGRIKGKVFPGGSLASLRDGDIAVSQGVVDVAMIVASYSAPHYPVFNQFGAPGFCAPNWKAIQKVDQTVRPILSKVLARGNIKYIFPTYEGEMGAYIRKGKHPLLSNKDWKDLKMRVPNKERGKLIRLLGATSVVLPVGELAMALQRGTVDGVLTAWPIDYAFRLSESAPNVTIIDVVTAQWGFFAMNMNRFQGLSPQDQQILMQAGNEATVYNGEVVLDLKKRYFERLKKLGITPNFFTSEETKIFLEKGYSIMDELKERISGEELELYKALRQFRM